MKKLYPMTILVALALFGAATAAVADEPEGRGPVGTYFITEQQDGISEPYTRLLTLFADGNMRSIQALQFGLGIPGFEPFSSEPGAWKKTGEREVTATTLVIQYMRTNGAHLTTCIARIVMEFDDDFQTISGAKDGECCECYAPDVNVLAPDEEPLFPFSGTFVGERLSADDDEDSDDDEDEDSDSD